MLDRHVLDDAVGAAVAAPGSTVSLAGTLALSSGTVTGTPIDLFRSVDGAADTSLGTVAAASDGSFTLDDAPPDGEITTEPRTQARPTSPPRADGRTHPSNRNSHRSRWRPRIEA